METHWGIDLGGTKIEGVVLPVGSTEPLCRLRLDTEAKLGYDHIVGRLEKMVTMLEQETGQDRPNSIGIGTPGTSEPSTGRMKNCNTTALNGQALATDLTSKLGVRVLLANDANCFALAEAHLGAAKGANVVFGVILGTGVGGGLVVDGRVLNGAQGIAGEWGHNELESGGTGCYCGKRGCVETVLSGPALERFYRELSGNDRRLPDIVSRRHDDPAAAATIDRLIEGFGKGLSVIVNILDPDVIVIGGGVGNIDAIYDEGVAALERWVFNSGLTTRIVRPNLGDSAGVFGAAMLTARL